MIGIIRLAFYACVFFTGFSLLALTYGFAMHDWKLIADCAGLSCLGLFASSLLSKVVL